MEENMYQLFPSFGKAFHRFKMCVYLFEELILEEAFAVYHKCSSLRLNMG